MAIAVATAAALLVPLTPALASAAPAFHKPRRHPQVYASVPGTTVKPQPAPARRIAAAVKPPAAAAWPSPGSASVSLARGQRLPVPGTSFVLARRPVSAATAGVAEAEAGVSVTTQDQDVSRRLGLSGVVFTVTTASADPDDVDVDVDYAAWAGAVGGDWAGRLQVVALPGCATSTPQTPACAVGTPVAIRNDQTSHRLSLTLPAVRAGATRRSSRADAASTGSTTRTFAVTAGAAGATGSYAASSLAASSSWHVGPQTGDFTWSYPFRVPPAVTGPSPQLGIDYSSGSVDGRTESTNNQTSWVGEGHSLEPGYVERSYVSCADDMTNGNNSTRSTGDLCWRSDNATVVLAGHSSELVKDTATGTWKLRSDDGSKIERLNTGSNTDNDRETWVLTTQDGTRYVFGQGLRGPGDTAPNSNATWTVPVAGNQPGEPCHTSTFGTSFCTQAWRWNLDYIVDTHGNSMSYRYTPETNNYLRNKTVKVNYVRGGYLNQIEYGEQAGSEQSTPAPAQVLFATAERCIATSTVDCAPATLTATTAPSWPDVPFDLVCADGAATCTGQFTPSFFSRKRLTGITTQVRNATSYDDVDSWALEQSFPDPGDGSKASLWLDSITHTGKVGADIALPKVTFDGIQLQNRVDGRLGGAPPLIKWRVNTVRLETGGVLLVQYSDRECAAGDPMPAEDNNDKRCFPAYYAPQGATSPVLHYFHKYVVDSLSEDGALPGGVPKITTYQYLDTPAWHYDDNELKQPKFRTWSDWRGYSSVRVLTGAVGAQSAEQYLYMRGMDGDPLKASGRRAVSVRDSQGGTLLDQERLSGYLREHQVLNGPAGAEVEGSVNTPWVGPVTATGDTHTARMLQTATVDGRRAINGGPPQASRVTTQFDAYGLPVSTDDAGDLAVTTDDLCTRTQYARNPGSNLVDTVSRSETVSVRCAATPSRPGDVVSDTRSYYDGAAVFGAAPTLGDLTMTEQLADWTTKAVYVQQSALTYDVHGRNLNSYDALGRKTSTAYTPPTGGPVTAVTTTNPVGHVDTTTLDPARGDAVKQVDANGKTTEQAYDGLGRLTGVWMPDRPRATATPNVKFSYQVRNDGPSTVTTDTLEGSGAYSRSTTLFDGLLRPRQTQAQAPLQPSQSTAGRIVTDTRYDARGLTATQNGPYYNAGAVGADLLDVADNAMPTQTTTSYDNAGRPTISQFRSYNIDKWRTVNAYGGDRVTTTPPDGGVATTTITDLRGRTTELRQYKNGTAGAYDTTRYTYTPGSQLSTVADPAGNAWRYSYDLRHRLTSSSAPDTGTTTSTYDDAGQPVTTTDARGQTLAVVYDDLGRRTELHGGSSTGPLRASWTYDTLAKGTTTSATRYDNGNAYTSTVNSYDALYRPLSATVTIPAAEGALAGTYTTAVGYNQDGSIYKLDIPTTGDMAGERLTYSYNELGQPKTMNGAGNYVADATYNPFGERNQIVVGSVPTRQTTQTYEYDEATQRLSRAVLDRETVPTSDADLHYSYDDAGNLTKVADTPADGTADTQCFNYDYLRRLTQAWTGTDGCAAAPTQALVGGPAPYWQSYTYDLTGNRTSRTDHSTAATTTTTSSYPPAGQPQPHAVTGTTTTTSTSPGTANDTFNYDAAGNTTQRNLAGQPGQTLTWDVEDHLKTVSSSAGTTSYLYDANGERLLQRDPAGTTLYLDNQEIRLDKAAGATPKTTRFYQHNDQTIAQRGGGAGLTYLFDDPHGTAEFAVTDSTTALSRRRSGPFGDDRGTQPTTWPNQHGFLGGTKDPTGLTHLGAREYDPTRGRFISSDPITDHSNPQQTNSYAYANNNPTTNSDPTGLMINREEGDGGPTDIREAKGWVKPKDDATAGSDHHSADAIEWATQHPQTAADYARNKVNGAESRKHEAKRKIQEAAVKIVKVVFDVVGVTAGFDCIVNGDASSCGEVAVNILSAFAGGLAGKLLAKYGLPWKWAKASRLAKKLWSLVDEAVGALKGWRMADQELVAARHELGKATEAASCSINSFTADTPVLLANRTSKPIEQIKVGDQVTATDPQTGETEARPVTQLIRHTGPHTMVDLTLADGSVLHATDHHPLWDATTSRFTYAIDLHPGEQLRRPDGTLLTLATVVVRQQNLTAYNLTISGIHTYYAGTTPLLVHNSCGIGQAAKDVAHVADRHMAGGRLADPAGKSIFASGESVGGLMEGAQGVARTPQAGRSTFARTVFTDRLVGWEAGTQQGTFAYTVITRADDSLVTAFPGVP